MQAAASSSAAAHRRPNGRARITAERMELVFVGEIANEAEEGLALRGDVGDRPEELHEQRAARRFDDRCRERLARPRGFLRAGADPASVRPAELASRDDGSVRRIASHLLDSISIRVTELRTPPR